jgi:hypothetical protein
VRRAPAGITLKALAIIGPSCFMRSAFLAFTLCCLGETLVLQGAYEGEIRIEQRNGACRIKASACYFELAGAGRCDHIAIGNLIDRGIKNGSYTVGRAA